MAQIPASQQTQGTILTNALKRAGNTKIKALARVRLFQILDDLALDYDWPQLEENVALTLTGLELVTLPSDFIGHYDDDCLTLTSIGGSIVKQPVTLLDRQSFEQRHRDGSLVSGTAPTIWTIDYRNGTGKLFPIAQQVVTANLRYKARPVQVDPELNNGQDFDNANAWFPYSTYLFDAIYAWALEYDQNVDATNALLKAERGLDRIRGIAIPHKAQRSDVPLDNEVFTTPYRPDDPWGD